MCIHPGSDQTTCGKAGTRGGGGGSGDGLKGLPAAAVPGQERVNCAKWDTFGSAELVCSQRDRRRSLHGTAGRSQPSSGEVSPYEPTFPATRSKVPPEAVPQDATHLLGCDTGVSRYPTVGYRTQHVIHPHETDAWWSGQPTKARTRCVGARRCVFASRGGLFPPFCPTQKIPNTRLHTHARANNPPKSSKNEGSNITKKNPQTKQAHT